MSEITPEVVRHLAALSRIELNEHEIESMTNELDLIVDNIAKIQSVAHEDVPPMSHPVPLFNVMRQDRVGVTLTQDQALSNAPDSAEGKFRVPTILGDEQ